MTMSGISDFRFNFVAVLLFLLALLGGMFGTGCHADQEQGIRTEQPVEASQPARNEAIQQTPTQGPFAYSENTTNPHGKMPWDPKFFKQDETADVDAGSAFMIPPEIAGNEKLAAKWIDGLFAARTQNTYNWWQRDIHTTQTVSNTHDGTLSQSQAANPSASQSPNSTSTGGAQDQRQQPTASTAIDVPVNAAPGGSVTGGQPQATSGGGEAGQGTGAPQTNTPTSSGNNAPPAGSTAIPPAAASGLLARVDGDPVLRDAINAALANNGQSNDATVAMILGLMQRDPNFAASVLSKLGPAPTTQPAEGD